MSDRWYYAGVVAMAAALLAFIAFIVYQVNSGEPVKANPPQQSVGHVSSDDLRNGITAVTVTVGTRRIPCVYASDPGSSGGWAGGVAITCDWSKP